LEVRHGYDVDFRTGKRLLSVETSFMHWSILYQKERQKDAKTTYLGAHVNAGNGEANCVSLWAKAGCDGKLSFSEMKKWQVAFVL
jgi:hypothetical protein